MERNFFSSAHQRALTKRYFLIKFDDLISFALHHQVTLPLCIISGNFIVIILLLLISE
jgi:hypothetical protein